MSSIYGYPVKIPKAPKQATSLGAAIAAGVGAGFYDSYTEAVRLVDFERRLEPEAELEELHSRQFRVFRSLYPSCQDLSDRLSGFQSELFN
jgi:sugar (pentulose or hexulose) kinase